MEDIAEYASPAAVPDGLAAEDAAPLMCAGITTFNALRHSGAMPGDLVAIQAIGGLGHLAVQFASKFGYRTVAISRGNNAKDLALKLGAHAYINSDATNQAILTTAPSGKAMSAMVDGLGDYGRLMVMVSPIQLIGGMRSIQGWAAGVAADSEDTLGFSVLTGVRPIETFKLEQAAHAYERMMSGKARFRVVLTM